MDMDYVFWGSDDFAYCEDCYHDFFSNCTSCGECVDNDYIEYYLDEPYCEGCTPVEREGNLIFNLENKSIPVNSRKSETFKFDIKTLVGLEVECVIPSADSFDSPMYWNSVNDGSISPPDGYCGLELVSTPANGDLLMENIDNLMLWKKRYGADVNSSCGFHVHFNSLDMSAREVAYVGIVYKNFQNLLKDMMPRSRQSSNWCKDFQIEVDSLEMVYEEQELIEIYYDYMHSTPTTDKYNDARYCALNLHSRYYHGTIEFRLHSATINKYKITSWISILNAIINKSIELSEFSREKSKKWLSMSIDKQMEDTFKPDIISYMKKRIDKFKLERS
tara:strand:- start:2187 stop:3185 length:999 start_codon:yes stop_codon:yes gene_type:complete